MKTWKVTIFREFIEIVDEYGSDKLVKKSEYIEAKFPPCLSLDHNYNPENEVREKEKGIAHFKFCLQ
jgi:hypothetical protein